MTVFGWFVDVWGYPVGKALYFIIAYLSLAGKVKDKTGEQRANMKNDADKNHRKRMKRFACRKFRLLKDEFWDMTREFSSLGNNKGRIFLDMGKNEVDHRVDKYTNEYFEESRKILMEIKKYDTVYDFDVEANTFKSEEERIAFLDAYTEDFRRLLLSDIHKVVNCNKDVTELENKYITYEYLRNMFEKVLYEVEKSNNIMSEEKRVADKRYTVSTLNVFKVLWSLKRSREK